MKDTNLLGKKMKQYRILDVISGTYHPRFSFDKQNQQRFIKAINDLLGYDKYELIEIEVEDE